MSDQAGTRGFFDGNPKMLFVFGLVSGIALTLLANSAFAGGGLLANANGGAVNTGTPTVAGTNTGTGNPAAKDIPAITDADHIRGNLKKADVVVVEYSDFQCPFCERHHPTLQQLKDEYGDRIAWVYRHFPLSFHPEAMPAAIASECADNQGKFWEYADALFANQSSLSASYYPQLAALLGLDVGKFNTCLTDPATKAIVQADQAGGSAAGVNGTPATFINGVLVADSAGNSVGAAPYATFKAMIDAELAK